MSVIGAKLVIITLNRCVKVY